MKSLYQERVTRILYLFADRTYEQLQNGLYTFCIDTVHSMWRRRSGGGGGGGLPEALQMSTHSITQRNKKKYQYFLAEKKMPYLSYKALTGLYRYVCLC